MKVIFSGVAVLSLLIFLALFLAPYSAPAAEEPQTVIIVLKDQPQAEIAAQVWAEKQEQLEAVSQELRQAQPLSEWRRRHPVPLTRQEENALVRQFAQKALDEATITLLQEKADQVEIIRQSAQQEIYRRSLSRLQESQAPFVQQIEALGGEWFINIPCGMRWLLVFLPKKSPNCKPSPKLPKCLKMGSCSRFWMFQCQP